MCIILMMRHKVYLYYLKKVNFPIILDFFTVVLELDSKAKKIKGKHWLTKFTQVT